jgi:hypothetical protein
LRMQILNVEVFSSNLSSHELPHSSISQVIIMSKWHCVLIQLPSNLCSCLLNGIDWAALHLLIHLIALYACNLLPIKWLNSVFRHISWLSKYSCFLQTPHSFSANISLTIVLFFLIVLIAFLFSISWFSLHLWSKAHLVMFLIRVITSFLKTFILNQHTIIHTAAVWFLLSMQFFCCVVLWFWILVFLLSGWVDYFIVLVAFFLTNSDVNSWPIWLIHQFLLLGIGVTLVHDITIKCERLSFFELLELLRCCGGRGILLTEENFIWRLFLIAAI